MWPFYKAIILCQCIIKELIWFVKKNKAINPYAAKGN